MNLAIGFLPIIFSDRRQDSHLKYTQREFETPTEEPVLNAVWDLRVFKHSGWEVEIFSVGKRVDTVREWVSRYAPGLVDRVSECGPEEVIESNRTDSCFGREVNWVGVVMMLNRMGFLRAGLLPFDNGERKTDMVALLKEPVFQDLMSGFKKKYPEDIETRDQLIKLIGDYIKHPEIVGTEGDLLVRAKVEGSLLESVLKLLTADQLDPLGCVILAQQYREIPVAKLSPLHEADIR